MLSYTRSETSITVGRCIPGSYIGRPAELGIAKARIAAYREREYNEYVYVYIHIYIGNL